MSDEKLKMGVEAVFNRYLKERKFRRTPERYAILRKVLEMNKHFYAETIYNQLESDGYHVSRATVYNTIPLLAEAGIVRRHQFSNQAAQYEKIVDVASSSHQHLICLKCGKVKEFKDTAMIKVLSGQRYNSFTPEYFAFYVYGTCSQCQRKLRKNKKEQTNKLN